MSEADASQSMENKCPNCGGPLPSGVLGKLCPACLFKQGAVSDTGPQPETAPFQPPSVEEVARLFPQLELLGFLGKGGMGAVYKARQPGLDRVVALKILPAQTASGPGFVERFNREARALAKLSHPNIVAVYEFGQVNGLPYFIMEFVDGLNLRQLEQGGRLTPREALQIVPQICEALQFAHDEGIVHRDIKPENILVDKKGRVKIADFGIAKILGGAADVAITETKGAIGTPHYMAPEQMEKPQTVDHRADIFSLGVVFYEMLTGELPLGKFAPPSSRKVEVDVRLDDVVLRALEKDPERRYQHVSQVKTAVDSIATTAPPAPPPSGEALTREILARGYALDIGSCLHRGWALVWGNFWLIVGVNALITVLWLLANSSGAFFSSGNGKSTAEGSLLGLLLTGPLTGGLWFFYLKRIRGETTTVETAFSGFSNRFLNLFLGFFVPLMLIGLGFVCLILPGIYLWVSWIFTLPLVMDKGLDFWSAMEISRKIVSRHWWKFFGFIIILLLLKLAGIVFLIVGVFIAAPIAKASLMYAYEDLFGAAVLTANPAPAGFGPSGTQVLPGAPAKAPPTRSGTWKLGQLPGYAIVAIFIAAMIILVAVAKHLRTVRHNQEIAAQQAQENSANPDAEVTDTASTMSRDTLAERLEAASVITDVNAKDKLVSAVTIDAAKAGQVDIVTNSLQRIWDTSERNQTAQEAVRELARHGMKRQAIEIAKTIQDTDTRDQALSELAR
ncbi:MAG TPA: protein kinase [Candidatus Baltobacteraceae bacterium]|jgi:predicted Ser/Thr protein kinase|nr:protein kinase [Candidatus Baltobacteraceae bacterium]